MTIKNIEELRDSALDALQKLRNKDIDVSEAGIIAKLSETVMTSVRLQLEYSHALNEVPNIKFLEECHKSKGKIIDLKKESKKLTQMNDDNN